MLVRCAEIRRLQGEGHGDAPARSAWRRMLHGSARRDNDRSYLVR